MKENKEDTVNGKTEDKFEPKPTVAALPRRDHAVLRPLRENLSFRIEVDADGNYSQEEFSHVFMRNAGPIEDPLVDKSVMFSLNKPYEYDLCFMSIRLLLNESYTIKEAKAMLRWFRDLKVGYGYASFKWGDVTTISSWKPYLFHMINSDSTENVILSIKDRFKDQPKEIQEEMIKYYIEQNSIEYEARKAVILKMVQHDIFGDDMFSVNSFVIRNLTSHQRLARKLFPDEKLTTHFKSKQNPPLPAEIEVVFYGILYADL